MSVHLTDKKSQAMSVEWVFIAMPMTVIATLVNAFLTVEGLGMMVLAGPAAAQNAMFVIILFPCAYAALGGSILALIILGGSRAYRTSYPRLNQAFWYATFLNALWTLVLTPVLTIGVM